MLYKVDSSSGDVVPWQAHTLYRIEDGMMSTRIKQIWYLVEVFRIKQLFKQVFFDFQYTQRIQPREIQTLWSHNHDAGSYETLYEVDRSSGDVVIYWTLTGTHVVPNRQQYDEHTHQADMVPGGSISYQTVL